MVASHVGGIVAQVQDGETGWLVDPTSPEECARACLEILGDPAAARQRALRGKEYVRRNFLMPRLLRDWLVLFNLLPAHDTAGAEVATVAPALRRRDRCSARRKRLGDRKAAGPPPAGPAGG